MFIWPCYPSEVLKERERGAPFVPQEPADGCNPFQNAHWKSIKAGWTWCMSVEAGDTFLREGSRKETQVGSNKRLWCFPAKKSIVREERRNELRPPPPTKARLLPLRLSWTQLPSPHRILGLTSPAGGTTTKTSKHWHHALIRLLRDIHCGRVKRNRRTWQKKREDAHNDNAEQHADV